MDLLASPLECAVRNRIRWYQAMCDAHGIRHVCDSTAWYALETPPPFHPNLLVLVPGACQHEIERRLLAIQEQPTPRGIELEDSYAALDLAPQGFQTLSTADWVWMPPSFPEPYVPNSVVRWWQVRTQAALEAFEAAWRGLPAVSSPLRCRQFPPSLLNHPDLAIFIGQVDGKVVAGGIANRSPGAAGLSNFFVREGHDIDPWPDLVRLAREAFPGLPLTGYARSEPLKRALQAGFRTLGEVRVLYRPPLV